MTTLPVVMRNGDGRAATRGDETWDTVLRNVEGFRAGAARLGLTGSWDRPAVPITVDIRPPAGEEAVGAVEREIGEPIPPALRRFYRDVSAGLEIEWLLPGRRVVMPEGWSSVVYDLVPPAPFRKPVGEPPNPVEPTINAGHIRFFLDETPMLLRDMEVWKQNFRDVETMEADDPGVRLHYQRHRQWWDRAFPLGMDLGGNHIGVDRADEAGRLLWLNHTGSDAPGWFIDHTLPEFLLIQSHLGWTGFRGIEFDFFRDEAAEPGERERRYLEAHAADGEWALLPPTTYVLNDRSEAARQWRRWLGLPEPV
ncbi:hypothetical protein [Antarcticirhabdus aurantiaca]|uniref:Uncharacterized protein n=2 Tax=Antarcticirhabdus aurantiaca TaxID=2606717 RepID=A0ACD4NJ70_9HYPH|nr:hypothetical protein OXU80_18810 [Jeongeuplla avenae]